MSKFIRIIPKLDIKGNSLVKGINLEGLRVLGSPIDFAKYYYQNNADEIIYQDVVASLYSRENILDLIKNTAKEIFIPLTVGGGIRSVKDVYQILRAGADKVSINSAAVERPELLKEVIKKFGASTIVSSLEIMKIDNKNLIFTDNGRNNSNIDVMDWLSELNKIQPGEIIITFINSEGTGEGIDTELINKILKNTNIPIIVHGGFGKKEQLLNIMNNYQINGVAIGSMFHYECYKKFKNNTDLKGNKNFIENSSAIKRIEPISIKDLKEYLIETKKIRFC